MGKLKKKGFEVQFHWIFVMIVGTIILTFFFTVVTKQRGLAEEKLALRISEDLDTILSGASVAKGTAQVIQVPKQGLGFSCTSTCDCTFSIGKKSAPYKDKYIFAPRLLEESDLILWTLDWKLPFRGGNFLYVTNHRVKYFLMDDGATESVKLRQKVERLLPPNVDAEWISGPQFVSYQEWPFVYFIQFGTQRNYDQIPNDFPRQRTKLVNIQPGGSVCFQEGASAGAFATECLPYANDAELFGAIFADNPTMYKCNLLKMYERFTWIAQIYKDRLPAIGAGSRCPYRTAQDKLDILISNANSIGTGLGESGTGVFNVLQSIKNTMTQLEDENKQLLLASCPQVY